MYLEVFTFTFYLLPFSFCLRADVIMPEQRQLFPFAQGRRFRTGQTVE